MKKRRRIIVATGCALLVAAFVAPAAGASPLLSGYGGPGSGNQAILGSALLNGPGSGGGSGAGGPSTAQQPSSGGLAPAASAPASSGGPRASRHEGHHGAPASSSPQGASPAQTALAAKLAYARAERTGAGSGSGTLGLSGADFLYAALVLAGLALMGAITRRLTRATPAKGHG